MDINTTKNVLIEAHDQLCSFAKSLHSIGFEDNYFDWEFEWIQMCVGLCEIYLNTTDEFVKDRALKKINLIIGSEETDVQLSFDFKSSRNTVPDAIQVNNDPNAGSNLDLPSIEFEDVNF